MDSEKRALAEQFRQEIEDKLRKSGQPTVTLSISSEDLAAALGEIPEKPKTNPNRRENEFMMNLMILRNTLRTNAPACRERARLAGKWTWRDIRLMTTLVDRIQDAMLTTMPPQRDEILQQLCKARAL